MNKNRDSTAVIIFSVLALLIWIGSLLLSQIDVFRTSIVNNFIHHMIIGGLLMGFILHLSHFILDKRRVISLLFSICCLMFALINRQAITVFWEMSWSSGRRLEYALACIASLSITWFLYIQYPKLLHKKVVIISSVLLLIHLMILPFDIGFVVHFAYYFGLFMLICIVYTMVRFIMMLHKENQQFLLGFIGISVLFLFVIHDALVYRNIIEPIIYADKMFTAPIGMIFFVICHTLLIAMDYTGAKRKEISLIEYNIEQDNLIRIKADLFRNIAHDMKAPLTIISSEVQNVADLLDYDKNEHEMRESLLNAQKEVMNIARKVDKVIQEISMTEFSEEMKPLNIKEVIENTARTYRNLLKLNGNHLNVDIPMILPMVPGNYDSLSLMLSNLLSNANRFTKNGSITITAKAYKNMVKVIISDNGRGVNEELLPHIFKRGISTGGTGLGLSICKTVIETHNGKIWAESEYNKGMKIYFTLPSVPDKSFEIENS